MARPSKLVRKVDDRHLRLEYMGGRCAICRRSIKAREKRYLTSKGAFEFNHIDPAQKSAIYEKMIRRVVSTEQSDELDKCNLLCRMCHSVWTNQRLNGKLQVTIALPDGRVIEKSFRHYGLMELKKGKPKVHLFTVEPCHIGIYGYSLGSGQMVYCVGFELRRELLKLILATRHLRTLQISDVQGPVFSVERLDDESMRFEYSVRFPFLRLEFRTDDPNYPYVWARNGKTVTKGRGVRKGGIVRGIMQYKGLEGRFPSKVTKEPPVN